MKKETREQKFKRLAEARINKLFNNLRLLGNLSNRANYSYEKKDINKIFNAIEKETEIIKSLYSSKNARSIFTLDECPKPVKKPLETPLQRQILPSKKGSDKEETKVDRCGNCFENRKLEKYGNLWLCKRCYRKRKVIRKVKAINGGKGLRSIV